jgi:hypothetical protein
MSGSDGRHLCYLVGGYFKPKTTAACCKSSIANKASSDSILRRTGVTDRQLVWWGGKMAEGKYTARDAGSKDLA